VFKRGGKYGWSSSTLNTRGNLGDGVRPILEWAQLSIGSCETLFLQMQLDLISHLKFMWYSMLIVALLVLGIGFLHNIMNFLLDVLDALNKFGYRINLCLSMGGLFSCGYNGQSYVNGGQWLQPKAHLKRVVANRVGRALL
jgi:hypothetical protein